MIKRYSARGTKWFGLHRSIGCMLILMSGACASNDGPEELFPAHPFPTWVSELEPGITDAQQILRDSVSRMRLRTAFAEGRSGVIPFPRCAGKKATRVVPECRRRGNGSTHQPQHSIVFVRPHRKSSLRCVDSSCIQRFNPVLHGSGASRPRFTISKSIWGPTETSDAFATAPKWGRPWFAETADDTQPS
jgi:hypothetical protein